MQAVIRMRGITDDNLWRPTRRAEEHRTKDKLSTRRGAVHSIGWFYSGRIAGGLIRQTQPGVVATKDKLKYITYICEK